MFCISDSHVYRLCIFLIRSEFRTTFRVCHVLFYHVKYASIAHLCLICLKKGRCRLWQNDTAEFVREITHLHVDKGFCSVGSAHTKRKRFIESSNKLKFYDGDMWQLCKFISSLMFPLLLPVGFRHQKSYTFSCPLSCWTNQKILYCIVLYNIFCNIILAYFVKRSKQC